MIRCTRVRPLAAEAGAIGDAAAIGEITGALAPAHASSHPHSHDAADTITLDETGRHRRRLLMTSDHGIEFLLDLSAVTLLGNGDRLLLDDGREIEVRAAHEALYEIRGRDALHLLKLTWHMGNRHLPTEIRDDHVRIRSDAVIARMIEELGGQVTAIEAAFDPEGGAYGH